MIISPTLYRRLTGEDPEKLLSEEQKKREKELYKKVTEEREYTLDDLMPFKKYRDRNKSVNWVILFDTEYITWLLGNTNFVLSNEAYELYERQLQE